MTFYGCNVHFYGCLCDTDDWLVFIFHPMCTCYFFFFNFSLFIIFNKFIFYGFQYEKQYLQYIYIHNIYLLLRLLFILFLHNHYYFATKKRMTVYLINNVAIKLYKLCLFILFVFYFIFIF